VRAAREAGVTVIGFGINGIKVEGQFDDWIAVNDVRDIASAMLDRLVNVLLRDRALVSRPQALTLAHVLDA
jgi:hypothetical protein